MAIASSSVLKRNSGATGPKVSSLVTFIVGVDVGEHGRLEEQTAEACACLPPTMTLAPLDNASAMCSSTFCHRVFVDQRADVDAGFRARPDLERLDFGRKLRRRMRRRRCPAPGCGWRKRRSARRCDTSEIIAPSTAASRSASSNTRNGALPPSSSEIFLIVSRALLHQHRADFGGTGEGDLAHRRVAQSARRRSPSRCR